MTRRSNVALVFVLLHDGSAAATVMVVVPEAANAGAAETTWMAGTTHAAWAAVRITVRRLTGRPQVALDAPSGVWFTTPSP